MQPEELNYNGLNGKIPNPEKPLRVLRCFRVEKGTTAFVRTLTDEYSGLFIHYVGKRPNGRSHYCEGQACDPAKHRLDQTWKGYAPVEVWDDRTKKWCPFVLEITEHMDLEIAGMWKRGQVWEFWREAVQGFNGTPVFAKLVETRDASTFPQPFDMFPVLKAMYHVKFISLGIKNPLPPRVLISDSDGDAPAPLKQGPENAKPTQEQWDKLQEAFMKGKRAPSDRKASASAR
jgi:hypothetical protein